MEETRSMKKRIIKIAVSIFLTVAVVVSGVGCARKIARENKTLEIDEYVVESERLPSAFNGYKIAQVSDLHNVEFGENNEGLLSALSSVNADAIVLTGDLVDSRKTNVEKALQFVEAVVKIAPTYYVTGNHESRISEYLDLKSGLLSHGVMVLENQTATVEKNGEYIRFIGLQDPAFTQKGQAKNAEKAYVETQLSAFALGEEYAILLSHRPEFFEVYAEYKADLVFSGHAHGGQFRIPKIGGLFAPNQGFLPKYDAGKFEKGQTTMFVSRGLGNSLFPFRINNPPEIIVTTLKKK